MRTRSTSTFAIGSALVLAAAACTVMDGLIVTEQDVTVSDGGGSDGAPEAAPVDPCAHAYPPPPPALADTDPSGDVPPIIVAIRRGDFGEAADAGPLVAYDLDKKCTCITAGPSCAPFYAPPFGDPNAACDGDGGADLGGTHLIKTLSEVAMVSISSRFNDLIAKGIDNVLLRMTSYNGTSEDPHVVLAFYRSSGIVVIGDGGNPSHAPPKFDATDRWTIPKDQVISVPGIPDPYAPAIHSVGYVTGGMLVVSDPNVTLPLTTRLTDVVFTARLAGIGTGTPTVTGGTVAGRWSTADALRLALGTRDTKGKSLCNSSASSLIATAICAAADLPADPAHDDDPTRACDAAAVTLAFTAVPASLGDVVDVVPDPSDCDAGSFVCPPPPPP